MLILSNDRGLGLLVADPSTNLFSVLLEVAGHLPECNVGMTNQSQVLHEVQIRQSALSPLDAEVRPGEGLTHRRVNDKKEEQG